MIAVEMVLRGAYLFLAGKFQPMVVWQIDDDAARTALILNLIDARDEFTVGIEEIVFLGRALSFELGEIEASAVLDGIGEDGGALFKVDEGDVDEARGPVAVIADDVEREDAVRDPAVDFR